MENKSRDLCQFQGFPSGEVFQMEELISDIPHQVISQTLLEHETYSVSLFFFDAKEGISTDVKHHDILYMVCRGTMKLVAGHNCYTLNKGQCIVIPAFMPHSLTANSKLWINQITSGDFITVNQKGKTKMEQENYIKNIEKAKVIHLGELVPYQDNRVASLALIQKDTFTTTVMAMDLGCGVGPHICDGDALVFGLDGEGEIKIGEEQYQVKKGESIVMPAGIPHGVNAKKEPFKMLLLVSKPEK